MKADSLHYVQTYRLQLVRDRAFDVNSISIWDHPDVVYKELKPMFDGLDREHFVVVAVDTRNRPIGAHTVSIGSLSATIVHSREVFKFAILANAAAIILVHNHPSDDLSPSEDDIELTKRLAKAGDLMGIAVLDHLIFGAYNFLSLKTKALF